LTNQLPLFPEQSAGLVLADGSIWGIVGGDEKTSTIVSQFSAAMQLCPHYAPSCWLLVLTDGECTYGNSIYIGHNSQVPVTRIFLPPAEGDTFMCIVFTARKKDALANQLIRLSLFIAQQTQARGGFLLHGALIAKDGWGVILAGPGGVGKTTASRRLPSSWRSLSDDATLVVCDEKGAYWAHPWPTWSNFMAGGPGGTWDVSHAVQLKAVFFLQQAQQDWIEPIGAGQSVSLLVELTEQASWSMAHGQGKDAARALRLQRFENICALVKVVSSYHLHLSLDGAFWDEIERVVTIQDHNAT
jgi:SynChlorMet cassette protein ScmC